MGLNLGAVAVDDVKLGASQVDAVYQGANKLWPTNPVFVDSYSEAVGNGDWSINVSALDIQAGDLVMLLVSSDSLSGTGSFSPNFLRLQFRFNGCNSDVRYFQATGPITTISETGSSGRTSVFVIVSVYRNAGVPTNIDDATSSGNGSNPNPPQLTGIAPNSIVCAMAGLDDKNVVMGPPAGYTTRESGFNDGGSFDNVSAAWADLPTAPNATENPDPFDSFGQADEWVAWTLEIPSL